MRRVERARTLTITLPVRHRRSLRALRRSIVAHPPFTPLVLSAWLPLGIGSLALIAAAGRLGSAELLVVGLVLGAIAAPIAFFVDLQHRTGLAWHPPRAMMLAGALIGGPVAIGVSMALQAGFPAIGWNLPTLLIGPIEEAAKLLVPASLLIVHRTSQRGALICAITAAASFQAIENIVMAYGTLLHSDGGVAAAAVLLAVRGVLGAFAHCMWTATVAIAWFGTCEVRGVLADPRTRKLVGWLLVVAMLHSLWDVATGIESPLARLVVAGLALAGTLLAHHVATRDAARRWARARRAGVGRG